MSDAHTIVVTGASSGIGAAAVRLFHEAGHQVVVVGRDPQRTAAVADALDCAPRYICDFTRLDDVRRLAAQLQAHHPRIDVLANNSGGMFDGFAVTADGFERTLQVNHLAPALLTRLLARNLVEAGGRVVWTSSMSIRMQKQVKVDWLAAVPLAPAAQPTVADLHPLVRNSQAASGTFHPLARYAQAKLAMTHVAVEMNRRYSDRGLASVAFHPGVIASNFGSGTDTFIGRAYRGRLVKALFTSPTTAAQRLARLALGTPGVDFQPGTYVQGRGAKSFPGSDDASVAQQVWDRTENLLATIVD
ncbi:MAG: SDR family NAD(P)-dependent oxidoreductase [Cellulomonadaceae bacterium]|jgi:NAD(P)-dependent dehydrogenase (short-subunit alcohol dehydrogenase family)|nr:SDR family NAD(P)-dependent oxidoreductase [Cellulomonadaceae bacterium]